METENLKWQFYKAICDTMEQWFVQRTNYEVSVKNKFNIDLILVHHMKITKPQLVNFSPAFKSYL